ncbi:PEP/pyruvate-binding domain-containing protein [Allonocardiopsis opalescens]|uniref:Pyruvate phosphate dikinase-like enzyme n=1 Tax=Allonocardiopsis opalescens TaxID=1144618 RepID=A0A2T0Q2H8_9ACTN|nr:PEP/pyruvate-binding domain-containing protein [Allonocardiopsis opalescens]PRX98003.1 pyruvate phosphate dikinase-like enzyme [Allonocardiopsis opalescens]
MRAPVLPAGWIVADADYARTPIAEIGGKARGLGAILGRSAPCPPSFCVSTSVLRHCFAAAAPAGSRPEEMPRIVRGLSLPPELVKEIGDRLPELSGGAGGAVAVRSSFVSEDLPGTVSPGVYHSEIGLGTAEEVCAAVVRVWASAFTPEARDYRAANGLPVYELGMAVVVQHAPEPVLGGVAYTLLPGTADAGSMLIEYAEGAPVNVVENRREAATLVVGKRARTVADRPDRNLQTRHADELIAWSLELERTQRAPLDIEWLVDSADRLWLLQARRLPYPDPSGPPGRYTADARGTALRSPKLVPFRLAGEAAVTTVPASIILPAAFEAFKRSGGRPPPEVVAACRSVFDAFLARGPVSMRSVYWSALDSGDLMPQSGFLTSADDCMAHVVRYWRFIADNGRDDYTAEVALLVCNWTDLRASLIATLPAPDQGEVATVAALYGQLDGLESCGHDVYEIDLDTAGTRREIVPDKPYAVRVPGTPAEPVPAELRRLPVLDADERAAVAANLLAIRKVFGPARVEMLVLHGDAPVRERVVTWQVSPLTPEEARLRYFRAAVGGAGAAAAATGTLTPIRGPQDAGALRGGRPGRLAYVDFSRSAFRDPALANAMALDLKRAGCPVLLRGSLLSHFAALLRDYRVTVYPIIEPLDDVPAGSVVSVVPVG